MSWTVDQFQCREIKRWDKMTNNLEGTEGREQIAF